MRREILVEFFRTTGMNSQATTCLAQYAHVLVLCPTIPGKQRGSAVLARLKDYGLTLGDKDLTMLAVDNKAMLGNHPVCSGGPFL